MAILQGLCTISACWPHLCSLCAMNLIRISHALTTIRDVILLVALHLPRKLGKMLRRAGSARPTRVQPTIRVCDILLTCLETNSSSYRAETPSKFLMLRLSLKIFQIELDTSRAPSIYTTPPTNGTGPYLTPAACFTPPRTQSAKTLTLCPSRHTISM